MGTSVAVDSVEISHVTLHRSIPVYLRLYSILCVIYPLIIYGYNFRYSQWLGSVEWTFLFCLLPPTVHALSYLGTRWSTAFRTRIECVCAAGLGSAEVLRIVPNLHRGKAELVRLDKKNGFSFSYQRDKYIFDASEKKFTKLPYPFEVAVPVGELQASCRKPMKDADVQSRAQEYGRNTFDIPSPEFLELFAEHATAPFFVFQVFCVALWCLDEYWYYSLFTLFMLIVFEYTTVYQRIKTLNEFRTMSVAPFQLLVHRQAGWISVSSEDLVPGDVISVQRTKEDSALPADLLLLDGNAIVNEAMLSGESTPLLKESIALRNSTDVLDLGADGGEKSATLYGGTKVLQVRATSSEGEESSTPDKGARALVLKTGFGTQQGQLVRTMLFSTDRVTANNLESFLFIFFLLIFAIAASAYVWINGVERGLKKQKLLLDCILIITSVVPPELPMELSLAVNASLAALAKYAIFCTEPFRIPQAGRVDVCCFDKTGTITGENLVVEGIAGLISGDSKALTPIDKIGTETAMTLAAAHALVLLDNDGGVVGDPMEKTTLEALKWTLKQGDLVHASTELDAKPELKNTTIHIKRRFQFSSALKRMSTLSYVQGSGGKKQLIASVKGAPETLRGMYNNIPSDYDETYKYFTRRGSRVLALGMKTMGDLSAEKIVHCPREQVECGLAFTGFLVFHCPLKADAVETLKMLADSSHRCVMITGDNPLTAVHVARDVEIVDRDVMILDVDEDNKYLSWRNVDETKKIIVDPSEPFEQDILDNYDLCITGPALKHYSSNVAALKILVEHVWVYARVSPAQKELILTTLKSLNHITLMAGDGTNDVGALKQAHIGVALLQGTVDDLKAIAEHQKNQRFKKMYESQLKLMAKFNQPPPPVPQAIAHLYPELVTAQRKAASELSLAKATGTPASKLDFSGMMNKMQEMDDDTEAPQIKLGDASCAAPFTSKLSNVSAITHIIRQGRCTLVATIQMYKILALNCLITAYSLSVQYLDGIKFGDYQVTITGLLMSVCFLCISKAKPIEKLSKERPQSNIFNLYILLSVLLQFAIHIIALVFITGLANISEDRGPIDLEAEFKPTILNTAIYLLGLSQQVSTFAINYQGRPFRESISENPGIYWSLLGVSAVAVCGALDLAPDFNKFLQIADMTWSFRLKLFATMVLDYGICWLLEIVTKSLFADLKPRELVTRGRDRREARRTSELNTATKAESKAVSVSKKDDKKRR